MKRSQTVIFLALVLWGGIFFMAACDGGNGAEEEEPTPTPSAPNAPTIEDIYSENRELAILWDVVNNVDTYNLYWNTTGGVTTSDTSVTNLHAPYYVHTGLSLFKTYSYAVTAENAGGESGLSNEMSALASGVPEELWKRIASDPGDTDLLGHSVAVSGDYAVAGAQNHEDVVGTNRGAAYVFERNYGGTDNWGQVKMLVASDAADSDYFGCSVAIDGDYVVVGAFLEDSGGTDSGAAYVFYRNEGGTDNWGEVAKLVASDAASSDEFGNSVAISGDYVVVGAHLKNGGGTYRGAAYVFDRNFATADDWGEAEILTAGPSDAEDNAQFGHSVAISENNVMVGARYEDGGLGTDCGAVYIFNRNQGGTDNWGRVKKLTASSPEDAAFFGSSVAISGDFALVGARGEDVLGTNRGAAYLFDRNYGGLDLWGEIAKLTASDAENGDEFGSSVAIDGDYAIVGAYYEDGEGTSRGAAYIYYRNQGLADSWGEVLKLTASDAKDQDWFGFSVALSGDRAVVGAPYDEEDTGSNRGAVYIF